MAKLVGWLMAKK